MKSLLSTIGTHLGDMGRAEKRIAEVVQARPDDVIAMSMAALAEAADVSDPTIVRFCRRFGFDGYSEFKIRLGQSLVPAAPFHYESISSNDSINNVVRKTCRNTMSAIQRIMESLNSDLIGKAAAQINSAEWTAIYATGMSEVAAMDAEHKLQRLGIRCAAIHGRAKQASQIRFARPEDAILILSESGSTRHLVDVASAARAKNASVISITEPDSPLARQSDIVVGVPRYQHTEIFTPLASRLMHHLVINMLSAAIAIASGQEHPDQLPALDSWKTDKVPVDD